MNFAHICDDIAKILKNSKKTRVLAILPDLLAIFIKSRIHKLKSYTIQSFSYNSITNVPHICHDIAEILKNHGLLAITTALLANFFTIRP